MSRADNRGQWFPRFMLALAVACGGEPSAPSRDDLLARATQLDASPEAALAALPPLLDADILRRRAGLLDRLGRTADAHAEITRVLALAPTPADLAQWRLLGVSAAARSGAVAEVARLVEAAPITEHPALAHRAAADAPTARLGDLAVTFELALAAGDRLEELHGPAAALAVRERAVQWEPADADAWNVVARSRIAAGKTDEALAAWDRAIAIAPAQEAFRTAPIQGLVIAGDVARARERARALAAEARARKRVELLVAASAGAAHVDRSLAVELARDARTLRPGDGRLTFLVAQRLAEAGETAQAAREYMVLLVCGAHGRAWHRHEVAARLQQLGAAAQAALDMDTRCEPAEPTDLAQYVDALRDKP